MFVPAPMLKAKRTLCSLDTGPRCLTLAVWPQLPRTQRP